MKWFVVVFIALVAFAQIQAETDVNEGSAVKGLEIHSLPDGLNGAAGDSLLRERRSPRTCVTVTRKGKQVQVCKN